MRKWTVFTDIDFSENLTIGIKYEPQSCHWFNIQVSVISGIVKFKSEKTYHPYVSDSRVHDQVFSNHALKEMISSIDNPTRTQLVIESDNIVQKATNSISKKQWG